MEVFIAIVEDRHSDVEVEVFTERDDALDYARQHAKERASRPEDISETTADALHRAAVEQGVEFYVEYSCENDSVTVARKTVDSEAPGVRRLRATALALKWQGYTRNLERAGFEVREGEVSFGAEPHSARGWQIELAAGGDWSKALRVRMPNRQLAWERVAELLPVSKGETS